jgi:FKBP-type peptidyl-prolyl cis-trans isomerase FkpA
MRCGAKDATTVAMMKPAILACALLLFPACNKLGAGGGGSVPKLETEDQKTLYALGLLIGRNVQQFNLTPAELDIVKAGISDQALDKKPQIELQQYAPKVNQFGRKRSEQRAEKEKQKGHDYSEAAAKEAGAERTTSGMIFRSLSPGKGDSPAPTDTVKVNYKGTLVDGTEFDSSYKRGQPAEFPLNGVIPCWTEGVQKMKVGEKAKLVCPSAIAYGDGGRPGIPGGATLTFEVELLEIVKKPPPSPAELNAMHGLSSPNPALTHPPVTPPPATKKPATPPAKQ